MTEAPRELPDDVIAAIVEESVAACAGKAAAGVDHPEQRRRVRTVIEAIEAARQ